MTLFWGKDGEFRQPQGGERKAWRDLKPGDLLTFNRKIWRLAEVRPVPVVDWDQDDERYYAAQRGTDGREDWLYRPLYLMVVPVNGGKRHHFKCLPYTWPLAWVLSPHYPVCRECGEPWPCRELDIVDEVRKEAAKIDRLAGILPGCCWSCGEPVTAKQKSITFDGENLLLPGAPPPVFHMRTGRPWCNSAAISYEKRLVAADPERHPTLYCTGRMIIHVDSPECTEDPFCPGPQVSHPAWWNHLSHPAYIRRCLRCMDACTQQGIKVPEVPGLDGGSRPRTMVTIVCDGCGRVAAGGNTATEARKDVREAGGQINLPGGKDLCTWCVAEGKAVE